MAALVASGLSPAQISGLQMHANGELTLLDPSDGLSASPCLLNPPVPSLASMQALPWATPWRWARPLQCCWATSAQGERALPPGPSAGHRLKAMPGIRRQPQVGCCTCNL